MDCSFLDTYLETLIKRYPSSAQVTDLKARLTNLISEENIELPLSLYTQVSDLVRKIDIHVRTPNFINKIQPSLTDAEQAILKLPIQNRSVLMAYDFHYNIQSQQLSLIEINTNASAFLFSQLLYDCSQSPARPWGDSIAKLQKSFEAELSFCHKKTPRIAILDENIFQQKMYAEFLAYKDLFKSWGLPCEIFEVSAVPLDEVDFIYNRHTDFTFSAPLSKQLKQAYFSGEKIFSPHPREYLLLAAKDRLIDLANDNISALLIPTFLLNNEPDLESVWSRRKNLFFKPKNSFGGKAAYRGGSISRKTFDEISRQDFIAQEYRPAGTIGDWKFDLRFYVYQNEIQLGCARIYQGQVTNFSLPGGGLARLSFV